jgi:DNA repair protein SbcC/Rad50
MRIALKQFGCYDQAEFTFIEQGSVLLSAPSGKGKSTIIRAILFALYGTGQKLVSYGKKSCTVEMWFKGLHITRSKGPGRLVVETETEGDGGRGPEGPRVEPRVEPRVYEDDEAQHVIARVIHSRIDISQNAFLTLSANDKLAFLERIIFDNVNVTDVKTKVRALIKTNEIRLSQCTVEQNTVTQLLSELKTTQSPQTTPDDLDRDQLTRDLTRTENELHHTKQAKYTFDMQQQTRLQLQPQLQSSPLTAQRIRQELQHIQYGHDHKRLVDELSAEEVSLDTLEARRSDIQSRRVSTAVLSSSLSQARQDRQRLVSYRDIKAQLDALPQVTPSNEYLEKYNQCRRRIEDLRSTYSCPSCSTPLVLRDAQLCVVTHEETTSVDAVTATMREMEASMNASIGVEAKRSHLVQQLSKYKPTTGLTTNVLDERIAQLQQQVNEQLTRDEQLRSIESAIRRIKPKASQLASMQPPVASAWTAQQLETFVSILERNHRIQSQLDALTAPEVTQQSVDVLETRHATLRRKLDDLTQYEAYLQVKALRDKYTERSNELQNNVRDAEKQLQTALLFKAKITEAETIALSQLIHTINMHVQQYLDVFFEKDPLYAKLEPKEASRSQLVVSILYKGNATDLSCLSTGEQDRVSLAFSLAIQTILNHPIILLDECVSSLDQENADIVFSAIQDLHRDKLILLVAHQIVTGMFDQVVAL